MIVQSTDVILNDIAFCSDVVIRTPIGKDTLAVVDSLLNLFMLPCVKVVTEAYSVHAYYHSPEVHTGAYASWLMRIRAMGADIEELPNGTKFSIKAYTLDGVYCGRFNTMTGKATIIVWNGRTSGTSSE